MKVMWAHRVVAWMLAAASLAAWPLVTAGDSPPGLRRIDLAGEKHRQVVVDRDEGQYLGHPSTALLEDGKTMLCVYPLGHGKGALVAKRSTDGGLTWAKPEQILQTREVHLCEPGLVRSPDGKEIAALLRENRRAKNSHAIFSHNEGRTWSAPRELPPALTGDRHTGKHAPDGRLLVSFRDTARGSLTYGDWMAWVGTYEDIVRGRDGQYRVRLEDNQHAYDCGYPGVEVLPDGAFVLTTYGHWEKGKPPYILSVRLTLGELDRLAETAAAGK